MNHRLTLAVLALLVSASTAQAQIGRTSPYVVKRVQAVPMASKGQTTLIFGVSPTFGAKPTFFVVERRLNVRRADKQEQSYEWVDGRTCPALANVIAEIADLPSAKLATPKGPQPGWPPIHAAVTSVSGPAAPTLDGVFGVRMSDWGGSITLWWQRSEKRLESCWSPTPPTVAGAPIEGYMPSPEAAERWGR